MAFKNFSSFECRVTGQSETEESLVVNFIYAGPDNLIPTDFPKDSSSYQLESRLTIPLPLKSESTVDTCAQHGPDSRGSDGFRFQIDPEQSTLGKGHILVEEEHSTGNEIGLKTHFYENGEHRGCNQGATRVGYNSHHISYTLIGFFT